MDSFLNFLNQPLATILSVSLLILILSPLFRITIIISILFYGLGITGFAARISVLAVSLTLGFFAMQESLTTSFNHANFAQNTNSGESINRFLESWKQKIENQVTPAEKIKLQTIIKKDETTTPVELNSWKILAPSYVISELKNALSNAFRLLLPFIIIDLVIAYLFTALNIRSLSALTLSFPLKLLAFISVDGITLISTNILNSFS